MTAVVWLDGVLLPDHEARIDPADRGFLLADGVFETIRVGEGTIWHLGRHLARLREGAQALGLPVPVDDAGISRAIRKLLTANRLREGSLRLTLTAGRGRRGLARPTDLAPSLLISCTALGPPLPPAALIIAHTTRRNEHSPLSRIKALGYGDQILARREAAARGADDAILLNGAGVMVCGSAANLLLHNGAEWLTPPVADGALPGITRGLLIEAGLIRARTLLSEDLAGAAQILLVNALGVRSVTRVGARVFTPLPALVAPLLRAARDPDIVHRPF